MFVSWDGLVRWVRRYKDHEERVIMPAKPFTESSSMSSSMTAGQTALSAAIRAFISRLNQDKIKCKADKHNIIDHILVRSCLDWQIVEFISQLLHNSSRLVRIINSRDNQQLCRRNITQ